MECVTCVRLSLMQRLVSSSVLCRIPALAIFAIKGCFATTLWRFSVCLTLTIDRCCSDVRMEETPSLEKKFGEFGVI